MAKRKASRSAVSASEEKPPREHNFDFVGKGIFRVFVDSVRLLGVQGRRVRRLATELVLGTVPMHVDVLVHFRWDSATRRQRCKKRKIQKSVLHVEVVENLGADLVDRMNRYLAAILREHGPHTQVLQYVLVVRPVRKKKDEDRVRELRAGYDEREEPRWIHVVYADELPLGRLRGRERSGLFAEIVGIMNPYRRSRAALSRLARRMHQARYRARYREKAELLVAILSPTKFPSDVRTALLEEVVEMAVRADNTTQGQREIIDVFLNAPALHDEAERTLKRVARRILLEKGESRGLRKGRRESQFELRKAHAETREARAEAREARAEAREARAEAREARAETIDELVDEIVRLLERRSIRLSRRQEAALRKKSAKQLVPIATVATTASNAGEFGRKARLNGRGNGHANGRANGRKNGRGNGKG